MAQYYNIYVEKLEDGSDPFISPVEDSEYGYMVKGIALHGISQHESNPMTIKLKCAAYKTGDRLLTLKYGIWVCDKPLYDNTITGRRITAVRRLSDPDGWHEKSDAACEDLVRKVFDRTWNPTIKYVDHEGLFIISTDGDNYDDFIVPTVVVNSSTRKGTVITDLQEYQLLKESHTFNVETSIEDGIVVYNPGVVPLIYVPEITMGEPFSRLVEKYQLTSNGGITIDTTLGNTPVCIDIEASIDVFDAIYADVEVKDARTLVTIYELSDTAHTISIDGKSYSVQCTNYIPRDSKYVINPKNEALVVNVKEIG